MNWIQRNIYHGKSTKAVFGFGCACCCCLPLLCLLPMWINGRRDLLNWIKKTLVEMNELKWFRYDEDSDKEMRQDNRRPKHQQLHSTERKKTFWKLNKFQLTSLEKFNFIILSLSCKRSLFHFICTYYHCRILRFKSIRSQLHSIQHTNMKYAWAQTRFGIYFSIYRSRTLVVATHSETENFE